MKGEIYSRMFGPREVVPAATNSKRHGYVVLARARVNRYGQVLAFYRKPKL